MPYIEESKRKALLNDMCLISTPGEMNYIFTMLCLDYISLKGESYQTYNDLVGAIENCKLELYRRKITPYEDKKRKENGDVYVTK